MKNDKYKIQAFICHVDFAASQKLFQNFGYIPEDLSNISRNTGISKIYEIILNEM